MDNGDVASRSQSMPADGRGMVGNPFYSEKNQTQCLIDAARPRDLPAQDDNSSTGIFGGPGLAGQPNAEELQPTGKGRGSCSAGVIAAADDAQPSGTRVLKTEGKLPSGAKQSMGEAGNHGSGDTNGLQQSGNDMRSGND